ncbi:MAG: MFS transporter [Chloroflexota bacterium]
MPLSVLLEKARGLGLFQIGALMSIYSFTIIILEVPTGGLADAIGRKRVAILSYTFSVLSSFIFLLAFSYPVFIFGAVISGVARALSSGSMDAWFVDSLQAVDPDIELQPALAKAETFNLLSLGVGALLGSLLPGWFAHLPPDGTAVLTPLSIPIALSVCTGILLVILASILVKEDLSNYHAGSWKAGLKDVPTIIRTSIKLTRTNPTIVMLLGATFSMGFAVISLESLWQPHFAELLGGAEGNTFFFGVVMGGNFLIGMLGNLLSTPLSRLFKKNYAVVAAVFRLGWGAAILMLATQTSPYFGLAFFWLVYLNMGIMGSPHVTLLNNEIPSEHRSSMMSIASFATYLGATLGGAGLGYLAEQNSIPAAWQVAGGMMLLSAGFYLRVAKIQANAPQPQAITTQG